MMVRRLRSFWGVETFFVPAGTKSMSRLFYASRATCSSSDHLGNLSAFILRQHLNFMA